MGISNIVKLAVAAVAAVAVTAASFAIAVKSGNKAQFAVAGQGPVQVNNPQVLQNIPQPAPQYYPGYPWGNVAYISAIANTPMQNYAQYPQYYPQQFMNGYSYGCAQAPVWNCDYGRIGEFNSPFARPSPSIQSIWGQPNQYCPQWPPPSPEPVLPTMESYVRQYPNGTVSFCGIPSCYDDNGNWTGK